MTKKPRRYRQCSRQFARLIGTQLCLIRCAQCKTLEKVKQDNKIQKGQLKHMETGRLPSWCIYQQLLDYYGYELKLVPIKP